MSVNYLRSALTPDNQPDDGAETLAELRPEIQVYEEIRVFMAKFDADDRQSRGEPVPEDIARLLGN